MQWQSALDPQGPQAAHLHGLFWVFVWVSAVVWVLVMVALLAGLRRRGRAGDPVLPPSPRGERRAGIAVGVAVAATVLIITGLTVFSYARTHVVSAASGEPISIRVRGYQWWWEVTYADPVPSRSFITANEIHIPVGTPVHLDLLAADVIHSFWVPNIAGKQDLIPGRSNELTIQADKPGRYRGQCAEFCGLQHAHMALLVVAEPPAEFERWRQRQLAPSPAPATPEQAAGRQTFEGKACAACHAVRGTSAAGTLGPDLTHVGGREYIAAGLMPTTRGTLAAWIADPQVVKPGNNMPMVPLSPDELRAVSAYLAGLQ